MKKILQMLENDARLTPEQIAVMTELDTGDIKKAIEEYENNGTIVAYKALIDWDQTDREYVSAVIELKVAPQRDRGFDVVAEKICNYPAKLLKVLITDDSEGKVKLLTYYNAILLVLNRKVD